MVLVRWVVLSLLIIVIFSDPKAMLGCKGGLLLAYFHYGNECFDTLVRDYLLLYHKPTSITAMSALLL